jgi:hypothetical protein
MGDFCRQTGYDGRSGKNCGRHKITTTGNHTGRYQIATDRMAGDGGRFTRLTDHFGGERNNGKVNNDALTNGI